MHSQDDGRQKKKKISNVNIKTEGVYVLMKRTVES